MAKVSSVRCSSYSVEEVQKAVDSMFKNLGGVEKFAKKGDRIFLKLNLVMRKDPDAAATTHPAVAGAVAKRLVEAGAQVIMGDSPGGPYTKGMLQGLYRACGMDKAAEISGAKLNFDCSEESFHHPDGVSSKMLTLVKPMMECDRIITISKLKTHGMTMYTGAVKVMFGAVPGVLKAEYHYKMRDIRDFSNLLVDICTLTKPALSIIDGIVGMEGDGPTAGTPIESKVLLASEDLFTLDVAGAYIMGIKPLDVPTIKRSVERGLTSGKIEDVEVAGEPLDMFKKSYKVPDIHTVNFSGKLPKRLERILKRAVLPRPVFSQELCIGCGNCGQSCPPKAISMVGGRPHVDIDKCIRCFCCQELCPQKAVNIKRPWILKSHI